MRKLSYLMIAVILAGFAVMTSCNDDDDDVNPDLPPSLFFDEGTDYIHENTAVDTNQTLIFGIRASKNQTSNAKLTNVKVERVFNNQPAVAFDTNINVDVFNIDLISNARDTEGDERWIFTVTDKDGEKVQKDIVVTTEFQVIPIYQYSDKVLGSYDATEGSSFASADGTVYMMSQAKLNSEKVDWMYSYGTGDTAHAVLMAPSDALADYFFQQNMDDFDTRNATVFKKVSGVDFDNITDGNQIRQYTSDLTETNVKLLQVGDVVAFITDTDKPSFAGKHGLIKITDIVVGGGGTITFDVKVEE